MLSQINFFSASKIFFSHHISEEHYQSQHPKSLISSTCSIIKHVRTGMNYRLTYIEKRVTQRLKILFETDQTSIKSETKRKKSETKRKKYKWKIGENYLFVCRNCLPVQNSADVEAKFVNDCISRYAQIPTIRPDGNSWSCLHVCYKKCTSTKQTKQQLSQNSNIVICYCYQFGGNNVGRARVGGQWGGLLS